MFTSPPLHPSASASRGASRLALTCCLLLLAAMAFAGTAGAQSFSAPAHYGVGVNPNAVTAGDFNGDGKPDLATANYYSNVSLLLNRGDGTFEAAVNFDADLNPQTITAGDFNEDGKLDLAVGNFAGGDTGAGSISILLGNGDGTFQPAVHYEAASPDGLRTADFNRDGNLDLVAAGFDISQVSVLLGNGDGTFQDADTYPAGAQPTDVAVADYNRDGKLDLAVGHHIASAQISILFGNGDGTFQAPQNYPAPTSSIGVAAADLNADGNMDLVVAFGGHDVVVYLGSSSGALQAPVSYTVGANISRPAVGDFNGDGKIDVVVGNYFDGTVSVLRGVGDGTLQAPVAYPAKPNPTLIVATDLDADGKSDLAIASNGTGRVHVLLNSPSLRGVAVSATAAAPATDVSVATFKDYDTGKTAGSFTATIDWGDGTAKTAGTVSANGSGGFKVTGTHTYAKEGAYTVGVRIADAGGNFAAATSTATVADAPLTPAGRTLNEIRGAPFTAVVASFTDADPTGHVGEFSAVIDWGDGTDSAGTITAAPNGGFNVSGSHTYASAGVFSIAVMIESVGGSTADAVSTANVTSLAIGGRVRRFDGEPIAGVTVALSGSESATATTDADGDYTFLVAAGGTYTVTPSKTNFTFNPPSRTFAALGAGQAADFSSTQPTLQFSLSNYSAGEGAGSVQITVVRAGDTAGAATVDFATADGTAKEKSDYTTALGTLSFAVGETSRSFSVLLTNGALVDGSRVVNLSLSSPSGAILGTAGTALLTIQDNDTTAPTTNPLDNARFFVRQHYLDFLSREPDAGGLQFWTNEITLCGADAGCRDVKRVNVSAAFFLSTEFQKTGYQVFRFYKSTYVDSPARPRGLPRYREFLRDTQEVGRGVIVGQDGWEQRLAENTLNFASRWVQSPEFVALFPTGMTARQYVDRLFANSGVTPTQAERGAAVTAYGAGGTTGRAQALLSATNSGSVYNRQYNPALVLMQYIGYMRRNPDDAPEQNLDFSGYDFWLGKMNEFSLPGEDMRNEEVARARVARAEMVRAFVISGEYRGRFSR